MAQLRLAYLPFEKDLSDKENNTWQVYGNLPIVYKSDGQKSMYCVHISSITSGLVSSNIKISSIPSQFVYKFYLWIASNASNRCDIFHINYGTSSCPLLIANHAYESKQLQVQNINVPGMVLNKWVFVTVIQNGTNLIVKLDNEVKLNTTVSVSGSVNQYSIGSPIFYKHSFDGYISQFSAWANTIDESLDYTYSDISLAASINLPTTVDGTYTTAPNKMKYFYKVNFNKSGNVVNYETTRILSVLRKILIINILYKYIRSLNF